MHSNNVISCASIADVVVVVVHKGLSEYGVDVCVCMCVENHCEAYAGNHSR